MLPWSSRFVLRIHVRIRYRRSCLQASNEDYTELCIFVLSPVVVDIVDQNQINSEEIRKL